MWMVEPDFDGNGLLVEDVIHIDSILRCAHLMPIAGQERVPSYLSHTDTLDAFQAFYVNKYIDHHAFEIAF
ncbi:hypothetical protein BDN72DRAFT_779830 [Pluteus cervinus]|nr:hypothetical protein BDN72DRAFT_779830 [Pluteus cervinus]